MIKNEDFLPSALTGILSIQACPETVTAEKKPIRNKKKSFLKINTIFIQFKIFKTFNNQSIMVMPLDGIYFYNQISKRTIKFSTKVTPNL
ncbi:MAG: hypothetical protein IPJ13_21585 [Saprospiraceae bacterium]|nr:hypothetical protein [Saprospiraceae bacterium]